MSAILEETTCCGVDELNGLEDARATLIDVCEDKYPGTDYYDNDPRKQAFLMFTDVCSRKYGTELAKYILKNNLGYVVATRAKTNPNSGNKIKAWLWSPNERNLRRWYKQQKV